MARSNSCKTAVWAPDLSAFRFPFGAPPLDLTRYPVALPRAAGENPNVCNLLILPNISPEVVLGNSRGGGHPSTFGRAGKAGIRSATSLMSAVSPRVWITRARVLPAVAMALDTRAKWPIQADFSRKSCAATARSRHPSANVSCARKCPSRARTSSVRSIYPL
jgi:hypothetical protein